METITKLLSPFRRARFLPDLTAGLALLGLILLFFNKLAFSNLILARGDMFLYFYPNWDYAASAVRAGHLPLWNPFLFMGVPFLANSQTGVLYPLNLALAWLPTTRAVHVSILLHLWLAGIGCYLLARRRLGLARPAALLAGALFALGGYLDAQAAHLNQLQALAWLPLLLLVFDLALGQRRWLTALAGIVALQLLAGHTQSVYISLAGLALYGMWPVLQALAARHFDGRSLAWRAGLVAGAAALGAALAAAQLVPTFELARESMRAGGLSWREAVSFSLNPLQLPWTVLPNYRQALFSEWAAGIGLVGLALAGLGAVVCWRSRSPQEFGLNRRAVCILALAGLFLAVGGYNPVYSLMLKIVPGFNLFRVPARWLAWYALGIALLAGTGLNYLAARLQSAPGQRKWATGLLLAAALIDLYAATRPLDYNHPTAPDALTDLRPSVAHLLAAQQQAPSRFLSISPTLFDPGDSAEMRSIWADQIPPDAFYDLLVATKQKEIAAPNLSLYYRLRAVDGYDGGILPLRNYVAFQSLFVPAGKVSPDGRLRENLRDVPDARWLSLMNARYIVTDKTLDAWLDDVFYDLQFTTPLGPADRPEATVAFVPRFQGTALGLVSFLEGASDLPDGTPVGEVQIGFSEGTTQTYTLRAGIDTAEGIYTGTVAHRMARVGGHFVRDHPEFNDYVTRLRFAAPPQVVTSVIVRPLLAKGRLVVRGASLIEEQLGAFQSLVLSGRGRFRQVHSGDVKIYENLDVLPRAFIARSVRFAPDNAAAIQAMGDPASNAQDVVLIGSSEHSVQAGSGTARIVVDDPEHIVVETSSQGESWLVLADAWYPGWRASVDGQPAGIARAGVLFRAVPMPTGQHRVEFRYDPVSLKFGAGISLAALIICLALAALPERSRPRPAAAAKAAPLHG